jgi:hypothetical protein
MKATEMANKPRQTSRANWRGTLTGSGLDLETKIFSASGRGRTFFLTSLFIELIEPYCSRHELRRSEALGIKCSSVRGFGPKPELLIQPSSGHLLKSTSAKRRLRQDKRPLLVRHIRQIPSSTNLAHPSMLENKTTPAKNLPRCKRHNTL